MSSLLIPSKPDPQVLRDLEVVLAPPPVVYVFPAVPWYRFHTVVLDPGTHQRIVSLSGALYGRLHHDIHVRTGRRLEEWLEVKYMNGPYGEVLRGDGTRLDVTPVVDISQ